MSLVRVLLRRRAERLAKSLIFMVVLFLFGSAHVSADPRCSKIDERVRSGPFDYREGQTTRRNELKLVESYHLQPAHRQGALRGNSLGAFTVWSNIDFVLRAFPNHPRALYLILIHENRLRTQKPEEFRELENRLEFAPAECYFERAMKFASDDPNVHNVHGVALTKFGKHDEAIDSFKRAVKLAPASPEAHYNLGLAYYAAKDYEHAAEAARKAYSLGYGRNDLKIRLQQKGFW